MSSLFSDNLARGFAIANITIVAFGVWCYVARVRPSAPSARDWVWGWVFIESFNGVGHILLAIAAGGYFPGAVTAPALLLLAVYLATGLLSATPHPAI